MSVAAAAFSAVVGLWLMAAPDLLGYGSAASSVHRIVGPVAASLGIVALWRVVRVVIRGNVVGAAVLLAAIAFDGQGAADVNAVVCGVALGALAIVPIRGDDRFAGGWIGLARRWRAGSSAEADAERTPGAPRGDTEGYGDQR